jgi:hypothetical protein
MITDSSGEKPKPEEQPSHTPSLQNSLEYFSFRKWLQCLPQIVILVAMVLNVYGIKG